MSAIKVGTWVTTVGSNSELNLVKGERYQIQYILPNGVFAFNRPDGTTCASCKAEDLIILPQFQFTGLYHYDTETVLPFNVIVAANTMAEALAVAMKIFLAESALNNVDDFIHQSITKISIL